MFWIFASVVGVLSFAASAGQYSVWYALMKMGFLTSLVVILVLGIVIIRKCSK